MTTLEMLDAVNIEMLQYKGVPFMVTRDILYWLNRSIHIISLEHYKVFEETREITTLLSPLVKTNNLTPTTIDNSVFTVDLSNTTETLWFIVRENVTYTYPQDTISAGAILTKTVGVSESNENKIEFDKGNPYGDYLLKNGKAKPLRVFKDGNVDLITDGNYTITNYKVDYIKKPNEVDYDTNTDLPEYSHPEIVRVCIELITNRFINNNNDNNKN